MLVLNESFIKTGSVNRPQQQKKKKKRATANETYAEVKDVLPDSKGLNVPEIVFKKNKKIFTATMACHFPICK